MRSLLLKVGMKVCHGGVQSVDRWCFALQQLTAALHTNPHFDNLAVPTMVARTFGNATHDCTGILYALAQH